MKKITFLLFALFCLAFSWQSNAQLVATQTFSASGPDSTPTVLTIIPGDINVNEGQPITATSLTNFIARYSSSTGSTIYCDNWYAFNLAVIGGVADGTTITEGCAADFEGLDVSGFTSITLTSVDIDNVSDTVFFYIDLDITYDAPACPAPSTLTATNIISDSAELVWLENGSSSNWDIEWGIDGFTPTGTPNVNDTGDNPYELTGLLDNTAYDFYVRSDCGSNDTDVSSWTGPFSFTTACEAFGDFTEGFESYAANEDPLCWSENLGGSTGYIYVSTSNVNTGTKALRSGNNGSTTAVQYIISPPLLDMSAGTHRLQFSVYGSPTITLEVGRLSDPLDMGTFTTVQTIPLTTTHTTHTVYYNTPNADSYFAFKMTYSSTYYSVSLDDVVWEVSPSCPDPSGLTASNFTSTSADLEWIENGTSSNWDIEWGTDGFTPTGTPNVNDTGDNPYELTGLSADTDYEFYVRSDCGADDTSDVSTWTGPFSFSTLVSCPAPTTLAASNITTTSADLGWTENGSSSNWDIEWGIDGFTPTGIPNVNDTGDNPYELTGLTSATAYDFYVRSDCGADDTSDVSVWVGPFSFSTSCDATNVPYVQDFNASTSIPLCTTVTNEGSGAYQWQVTTVNSYGFTANHLRIRWDSSNAANSWFFTQGINLTAGTSYTVSYDYGATGSESFPEDLKVAYGMSASSVAMVNELANHPDITATGPINSSINFVPATTGVYYFGFQCYSDADLFYLHLDNISVDVTLSNPEVDNLNGFKYYPNPVKNTLQLNAKSNIQNVSVYNMLGQEVLRIAPNNVDSTLDMSALQTGAYFVKVTINDRTETVRVIKN